MVKARQHAEDLRLVLRDNAFMAVRTSWDVLVDGNRHPRSYEVGHRHSPSSCGPNLDRESTPIIPVQRSPGRVSPSESWPARAWSAASAPNAAQISGGVLVSPSMRDLRPSVIPWVWLRRQAAL